MYTLKTSGDRYFAEYLETLGILWDYEKNWGQKNPDFTLYTDRNKNNCLAVIEVEDIEYSKEDMKILREEKILVRSGDPYKKIREKINIAQKQLKYAKSFPCCIAIYNSVGYPPDILIILASMLGDLVVSIPVSHDGIPGGESSLGFGKKGKMRSYQNTSISAVGFINIIRPDVIKTGYNQILSDFIGPLNSMKNMPTDRYIQKAMNLRRELEKKGFNIDKQAISLTFVVNPFSRIPFPKEQFQKGYTTIWEYSLSTKKLKMTYNWQ